MESSVLWLIGEEKLIGKVGDDEGDGLALRKDGEEILFAPFGKSLKWVPVTDFSTILEDDGEEEDSETPPAPAEEQPAQPVTPFPRRARRGAPAGG